jgi:phage I-like protein
MPMPIPTTGESESDFIKRFMADEIMIRDYPDERQRYAICIEQWKNPKQADSLCLNPFIFECNLSIASPTEKTQKILVFPTGKFYFSKYDEEIDFNKEFFQQIALAFNSPELSRPFIDKDHSFAESFGDILSYEMKSDGMYFIIKLNSKGIELVKNHEYRYISPTWGKIIDNHRNEYTKLIAISLTNIPAFEGILPELKNQLKLSKENQNFSIVRSKKEVIMELFILANEFGLSKDASAESVLMMIKKLKADFELSNKTNIELTTKLDKAEKQAIELGGKLKEIEVFALSREADEKIKEWLTDGQIVAATQDIVKNRYIRNRDETLKEMALIPKRSFGQQSVGSAVPASEFSEFEADLKILGLTAEELKAKMLSQRYNANGISDGGQAIYDIKNKEDIKIFIAGLKSAMKK